MNPMQGNVQQNPSRRYVVIQEPYEMPPHFLRLVFITILSQWKDDDPGLVVLHTQVWRAAQNYGRHGRNLFLWVKIWITPTNKVLLNKTVYIYSMNCQYCNKYALYIT